MNTKLPIPKTQNSVSASGDSFSVVVPILDQVVNRVISEIGFERGFLIYKKAVMTAGRVQLKAVKTELLKINGKFNKKNAGAHQYGETGALWRSMKTEFVKSRNSDYWFVLVGTGRKFEVAARRGRQTVYEVPGRTVHLVNNGFLAVSRIPGVTGRKTHTFTVKDLRSLAAMLKMEKPMNLSLARLIGARVDRLFIQSKTAKNFAQKAAYIAAYKEVRKTKVEGSHFMEDAASRSELPATQAAMSVMQTEFDKVLNEMASRRFDQ